MPVLKSLLGAVAALFLVSVAGAQPESVRHPEGWEHAAHVLSPIQEYGYPRGEVDAFDVIRGWPEEVLRRMPPGPPLPLWLPTYHDYVRRSAAVCSYAAASDVADDLHAAMKRVVARRPAWGTLYQGTSVEDCVAWRLKIQESMFKLALSALEKERARMLLTQYHEQSAAHLRKLGTRENPLSAPPYALRILEFADLWQEMQLAEGSSFPLKQP